MSKAALKQSTSEPLPTGKEHILFVDDERILAEMGKRILELHGYQVTISTNSIDSLNTFKSHPDTFDLVITDQSMPHLSGMEMAVQLLQIRADIPIILCTGYSKKISIKKAKNIGIKECCIKPLSIIQLVKTVRKILDER